MADLGPADGKAVLARIGQTVAATAIAGLLIWAWGSIEDMHQDVARIEERLEYMQAEHLQLKAEVMRGVDDRYRGRDADRDLKIRDEKITDLRARVRELEKQIFGIPSPQRP